MRRAECASPLRRRGRGCRFGANLRRQGATAMPFELPPLPYAANALEPTIDAQTMEIHHDKHHAAYVTNLNKALESAPDLQNKSAEDLIKNLNAVPESIRMAVRNNGGGHVNQSMFWTIMAPNAGGRPTGDLADAINQAFGGYDAFVE